jgi:hypothetical protein
MCAVCLWCARVRAASTGFLLSVSVNAFDKRATFLIVHRTASGAYGVRT